MILPVRPPWLLRQMLPAAVWRMSSYRKVVYLTFDDGPVPGLTNQVLDCLRSKSVPATFFCVGENALKHPEIIERIKKEGHQLGNHTMRHVKAFKVSKEVYWKEIVEMNAIFNTGLFRPPYGQMRPDWLKEIAQHYKVVLWDVLSYDYDKSVTPKRCLSNVVRNARNGSIIVFHDNKKAAKNMLYALPRCIDVLKELGYSFEIIPTFASCVSF